MNISPVSHYCRLLIIGVMPLLLLACADNNNNNIDNDSTVASAAVAGPISGTPAIGAPFFEDQGYERAEYFLSGTAQSYTNVNELEPDGKWQVQAAEQANYTTRIVAYRPINQADFNGTVVVEWLNVSAGTDIATDWLLSHTELIREGYAWVGVSAQWVGVNNLLDKDPDRYGELVHPGDSFSYDIFSQVGQAIRNPESIAPLGELVPEQMIAAGESQSASRMLTYVNALAPLHAIYDGYFIHSRYYSSGKLSQDPQADITPPDVVRVRDDLGTPVLMLQTETDVVALNSYISRQDDSDTFRLWEAPGTAHADLYTVIGSNDLGNDPSFAAVVENKLFCDVPVNSGPQHFIVNAAIAALNKWVADGTEPPTADRITLTDNPVMVARDSLGNAQGGIRTPYVDVPVATLSGEGGAGFSFCRLFGTTELFDAGTLGSLYNSDNDFYINQVKASTDASVSNGFILPIDGELIKTYAASGNIFP
jgi:hypothetical protein